jgi:hypothetical protein
VFRDSGSEQVLAVVGRTILLTRTPKLLIPTARCQSLQNIHFPDARARGILRLGMISSIAAKRITSSMPSSSIISTTTTSTITATGEWRN